VSVEQQLDLAIQVLADRRQLAVEFGHQRSLTPRRVRQLSGAHGGGVDRLDDLGYALADPDAGRCPQEACQAAAADDELRRRARGLDLQDRVHHLDRDGGHRHAQADDVRLVARDAAR
jgi:hypothetical protein